MNMIPETNSTPMMRQYLQIKSSHRDCLLFYRMGDFYELFFEDAVTTARILDIALTKRGKHDNMDIPMCGVPFHASDVYLPKLIRAGFKVAICEQLETPEQAKKRGYKEVVRREVVRIITPGTITEENLLDASFSHYLAAIVKRGHDMAMAWLDLSTGEFCCQASSLNTLGADLARINPKEVLVSDTLYNSKEAWPILSEWKKQVTTQVTSFFDHARAQARLKSFYDVEVLDSFGDLRDAEVSACGAIIEYVAITQKSNMPILSVPRRISNSCFMTIDAAARKSLELTTGYDGQKEGSVLSAIDKTVTSLGARLLAQYLASPLIDAEMINNRLDMVEFFLQHPELTSNIRDGLKTIADLERALSRLLIGRGGPRDLLIIKTALKEAFRLAEAFEYYAAGQIPLCLGQVLTNLYGYMEIINELDSALQDEVPYLARDGGFIRASYHPKLEEIKNLQTNSKLRLEELRDQYRLDTGVASLKIEQNNVLGFFIEVSPQQSGKMTSELYILRQSLVSGVRYTTLALKELESQIIHAKDIVLRLELEIFTELCRLVGAQAVSIRQTAESLAIIDVMSSFAYLAKLSHYHKPVVDHSVAFVIDAGRHPVVEKMLPEAQDFIPNSCDLSQDQRLWLLTGPNMAGKSTFLRQNALIAIMAQIGCYVPAKAAHIGIVDKVFSRVGAADDLARGRSTFMVEMVETATITLQATEQSLVILDEIGRGTSTYDGLSIAWSVVEYLHNVLKCRSIFATHYHELTTLQDKLPCLRCYSMRVQEWESKVIFLHEVVPGAAGSSYGIYAAKIAGIPKSVIRRAQQVLSSLENKNTTIALPLFAHATAMCETKIPPHLLAIEQRLARVNLDDLSPREAFELVAGLKEALEN